jgi:hypothetical protein
MSGAERDWRQYQEGGGIGGRLRLEAKLSDAYRTQAGRLASAYDAARRGKDMYASLSQELPPAWAELYTNIYGEAKRQRQSFNDLSRVLESALLREKTALLPQPVAEQSDQ